MRFFSINALVDTLSQTTENVERYHLVCNVKDVIVNKFDKMNCKVLLIIVEFTDKTKEVWNIEKIMEYFDDQISISTDTPSITKNNYFIITVEQKERYSDKLKHNYHQRVFSVPSLKIISLAKEQEAALNKPPEEIDI